MDKKGDRQQQQQEDGFGARLRRLSAKCLQMLFHAALLAALVALPCSWAKVFEKCELARELLYVHGFPEDQIPQWVCIAEHESLFNSSAVGHLNWDGSADHGLFQINDRYWCSPPGPKNECYLNCSDLEDDDITDDVECVRLIYKRHGFSAWAVWRGLCRGVNYSNYLNECISGKVGVVNSVLWNYGRK
ncbi:hypothetical protein MTO96_011779 [Rhipicephalus appendiculatus]